MWLACATQEEIAEAVGIDQSTAKRWADDFMQSSEAELCINPPGFTPPIYNVWKKQTKTNAERFSNCDPSHTLPSIAQSLTLLEHTLKLTA
jgi:hypothetical protein